MKLAKFVVFSPDLRNSVEEVAQLLDFETLQVFVDELVFKAIDVLKFCFEKSSASSSKSVAKAGFFVENVEEIVEILIKKIALQDEHVANFESFVQKNAFSLIFLVVKRFKAGVLLVFSLEIIKISLGF